MKKFTFTFLALSFALGMLAEPIDKQAALYTAKSYMLAKGKSVSSDLSTRRGAKGYSSNADEAQSYYYVFNAGNDGGYVIVSGDDRTEPILGYVEQGTFDPDNIPENMRAWLQGYADEIKYIVENDIQPSSPLLKKRNKVIATKHGIPEILTSRWNQGHPYNLLCPKYYKEDGTQHYPAAGCVATAMAQVVNHYKFPAKTKAVIPAHSNTYKLDDGTEKTVTMKAISRNTPIDWENMRDTYSCNDSHAHDAQDTAVAKLMLYCGQAVKMGYGASSGAVTGRARDVFVNYFGYNVSAYWGGRGSYSIDEWFDMLYNEIEQGYPVLYSGHSSGGGHAFVLDGFDGDNLFHVNWGWGGGSNGWFLVGILNPGDNSGMGASSSSDGYSMSQGALFNLRTSPTPKEETYLTISDVSVVGTNIKATFTNRTGATGTFNTGVVMQNEDGSLALVGTRQTISGMENNASQSKTFSLKKRLAPGTYRLSPASKSSRSDVWRAKYNMVSQYVKAEVDADSTVTLIPINISTEVNINIDTITFPGTRIVGSEQEVKVRFRNDGGEYFKTVYFFASKTQTKVYTESRSMVAVRSGETVDVSYFFKPEETGTYNLWFCTDDKGNDVIGQGTMEIITEEEATKANLSISSYTITNGSGETVYGKRLVGKASIKNNTRIDFHGKIKLQIWSQKIGDNTAWSGTTRTYNVDIAAGRVASIDFDFSGLSEGYYYHLKAMYGNQDGTLNSGGIWDHKWEMRSGLLTWRNNGVISGMAHRTSLTIGANFCGVYADCNRIVRMTRNKNPNTIYAFASGMEVPASLDSCNVVSGNHAQNINLINEKPFFAPVYFEADSASFTYTFPDSLDEARWYAFTMPFAADSVFLDSIPIALDDSLKHFWIYEYAAQGENGQVIFAPATVLRGSTPYIIAADATMAGRSLVFHSLNVPFFQSGSGDMVVSSPDYKFYGTTYAPVVKDCYVLNEEGTAFEYVTKNTTLTGLTSYFTTSLPEELRLPSIILPEIPVLPVKTGDLNGDAKVDIADAVSVLNIMAEGNYNKVADINNDEKVDIADFVSILNIMAEQ